MRHAFLTALAAVAVAGPAARADFIYGITNTTTSNLVSFNAATPGSVTTIGAITGLVSGHTLRGIDFRPSNGQLYALSTSANNTAAQLYTLNLATGAASAVGGGLTLTGNTSARVSLDFNPVVDALRVVTGSGGNYRVNANTGALIAADTPLSSSLLTSGIAYTNNNPGATQTTLYAYDFLLDNLLTIGSVNGTPVGPNSGQTFVVGNSGITSGDGALGFDISGATGLAYVSVDDFFGSPGFSSELFRVNLANGAFTRISGDDFAPLLDISVRPVAAAAVPVPPTALAFALAGVGGVIVRLRRRA